MCGSKIKRFHLVGQFLDRSGIVSASTHRTCQRMLWECVLYGRNPFVPLELQICFFLRPSGGSPTMYDRMETGTGSSGYRRVGMQRNSKFDYLYIISINCTYIHTHMHKQTGVLLPIRWEKTRQGTQLRKDLFFTGLRSCATVQGLASTPVLQKTFTELIYPCHLVMPIECAGNSTGLHIRMTLACTFDWHVKIVSKSSDRNKLPS